MPYDNTNSGLIAANQRKRNDRDPTHTGSINVDGKEYWVSAWVNTGKEGSKLAGQRYFSLKLRAKDSQQTAANSSGYDWKGAEQRTAADNVREAETAPLEFNDDIPF